MIFWVYMLLEQLRTARNLHELWKRTLTKAITLQGRPTHLEPNFQNVQYYIATSTRALLISVITRLRF